MMLQIVFSLALFTFVVSEKTDKIENELSLLSHKPLPTVTFESPIFIKGWPTNLLLDYLGEVSGVSFCPKGYLFVFQRAGRRFNSKTFNDKNEYQRKSDGPIIQNPIIKINNKLNKPKIVGELGSGLFYLPHGIHADNKYLWTTDIGLHQVMRIPHGTNKPDLILGEAFVPGNDEKHFCKPTHAITAKDGSIFVADGYCNSRIVKFDSQGKFIGQFGDKGKHQLNLPHHLVLIEAQDSLCVADRENHRVICFNAGLKDSSALGKVISIIDDESLGPVYAVGHNEKNDLMYIVSGIDGFHSKSKVIIYDHKMNTVTGVIDFPGQNGFGMVHSISVSHQGQYLALGGLSKECPVELLSCLAFMSENNEATEALESVAESSSDNELSIPINTDDYVLRNLWLYGLVDQQIPLDNVNPPQ